MLKHLRRRLSPPNVQSFLSRLLEEKPQFEVSELLGVAVMKLIHDYPAGRHGLLDEYLDRLQKWRNVPESMILGLTLYDATERWSAKSGIVELYSSAAVADGYDIPLPDVISVPIEVYKQYTDGDSRKLLEHLFKRRRKLFDPDAPKPER